MNTINQIKVQAAVSESPERSWTAEVTRFPFTYVSDPSHGSNMTITVETEDNSLPPAEKPNTRCSLSKSVKNKEIIFDRKVC